MLLADAQSPNLENAQALSLLDLMRQSGFTDKELDKLTEAKANSDRLATLELAAMKLAESVGSGSEANRERASLMLHDQKYYQIKATIMVTTRPPKIYFKKYLTGFGVCKFRNSFLSYILPQQGG